MEIIIAEVTTLPLSGEDPATLEALLAAGKKLPPEATSLLMQDHAEVRAMFRQHEAEEDQDTKAMLARKICAALTVHAQIEEEIFYPEAGAALEDDELVSEAVDEHGEMKEQIARIVEELAAEKSITRPVKRLMQLVEHHVAEEEAEMFPDMRQTVVDLYDIGSRLAAQRAEALLTLRRETLSAETGTET
jgi:hypothetical protein